ncbi:MAG: ABC transporter ATP-binding protein [Clostridia bacterium]|nr:ABC transporter ATP-binding protein [Clostridia bacterium]
MTELQRKSRFEKSLFSIFASYFKPYKNILILDVVCALGISLITLAFPMITRFALQNVLAEKKYLYFLLIMLGLMFSLFLRAIFQYIVTYRGHMMGVKMEADMRRDLFIHISHMDFSFFDKNRTGTLLSRMISDLFEISELAHHGPEMALISTTTLVGSFICMLVIRWQLALILFILIPFLLILIFAMKKRMEKSSLKLKNTVAIINSNIESSISGIRTTKAFNNESLEAEKFDTANNLYKSAKKTFYKVMGAFQSGVIATAGILNLIIISVGGYYVAKNTMSLVDLMTFVMFVNAFLMPINQIITFFEMFSNGKAGLVRLAEIMRTDPIIFGSDGTLDIRPLNGDIVYENVSFSYGETEDNSENKKVLKDINLTVKQGSQVAVVGPSGSGKTTLCQLLVRFYEITDGKITIGGTDIRDLTLNSLREQVGIVQQDVFIFADSILENIRYGRPGATMEEVISAAKAAEIHNFIDSLPDKYETIVGERGMTLSGGQRQRISIARIFLKNPPIMILDEATSALDTETEINIQKSLNLLSKGRTVLVIAHRLSTIKNADKIVYLDDHGIKEQGTHEELMTLKGDYYKLYNAQFNISH